MSNIDKIKINDTDYGVIGKLPYGVCGTAAGTAAKTATVDSENFVLETGVTVIVKFTNSNSASSPTLNVNSTGAIPIKRYGTTAVSTGTTTTGWIAGAVQMFTYDGTNWIRDYWNNTTYTNAGLGQGYGTCSTAAATKAKTVSLSSYSLTTGGIVVIRFVESVPAGATLNINSEGAKAIYHKNAAINNNVIKAGDIATFIYYSSCYRLISIDRWGSNINTLLSDVAALESDKMDKKNPTGTGSFSLNRLADTTVGNYSHAEGLDTEASGKASHAEGIVTTASGGDGSHAEGYSSTASGDTSHAEGWCTTASGYASHAEGHFSNALGTASHAEGNWTNALGEASHAEGSGVNPLPSTIKTDSSIDDIINSWKTTQFVLAFNKGSHAEGQSTLALNYGSHAEGTGTISSGEASHAEGYYTIASGDYQHVQGKFNVEDTTGAFAHIVGNGTADGERSNAHTLDWDGNAWFAGNLSLGDSTMADFVVAEGKSTYWYYRKWNSGKAEIWGSATIQGTEPTSMMGGYYSYGTTPEYPFTLTGVHSIVANGRLGTGIGWTTTSTTTTNGTIYCVGNQNSKSITYSCCVYGSWK